MTQRPMDADATEALLKLASKTVDDQLGRELKYPELSDFFNTDYSASYVAPDARHQILRRKRAISLPDTLFEKYNCMLPSTVFILPASSQASIVDLSYRLVCPCLTTILPLLTSARVSLLHGSLSRDWARLDHDRP